MMRCRASIVALVSLPLLAGCNRSPASRPDAAELPDAARHVLAGLRPAIAIEGEAPIHWSLAERMQRFHVPGVSIAVIDHDSIVWAHGFGVKEAGTPDSVTTETMFQAGSISKPTFAVGVMRLVQDGRLDLDRDVNATLTTWKVPDNRFTATEKVTLRRLLSHSAGLTVHGFPGYAAGTRVPTVPQVLDGMPPANTAPVRVDTVPGTISRYSGGGTTVAMLAVMDLTRQPFPQWMQATVLGPAGMTHSTYQQPLPTSLAARAASGHTVSGEVVAGKYHTYPEMSAAGLWTTPSDLARLAIELERTYAGRSETLINRSTLMQMLTTQKEPFGIGYRLDGSGRDLEFFHRGDDEGFVAGFFAFPERGQGAVVMTNGQQGTRVIDEILASLATEYGWPHHGQHTVPRVAIDSMRLHDLAGVYRLAMTGAPAILDTVSVEDGRLYMSAGEMIDRVELVAQSDSAFLVRETGTPIRFITNRQHRTDGMRVLDMVGTKIR